MAKNAITLDEKSNYLPVVQDPEALAARIEENLGGEKLSVADLDKAINPSGGSLKWEIPDIDGESETISEITGVIIHASDNRAWYKGEFTGGGEAPDCWSEDGVNGVGEMADKCGGLCENCPMDQFGSGPNGSKGCAENKRVYVLREDEMLPMVVSLTPTNRRALKTYGVRLMNKKGKALSEVVSKFTNSKGVSKSGFPKANVSIALVNTLSPEACKKIETYANAIKALIETKARTAPINVEESVTIDPREEMSKNPTAPSPDEVEF